MRHVSPVETCRVCPVDVLSPQGRGAGRRASPALRIPRRTDQKCYKLEECYLQGLRKLPVNANVSG